MVDNREVHIYTLKHPDTLEVRYVGKTVRSLSRRLGNHIANAIKGVPLSEEHKSKIGLANKGRRASESTRKKLSESHKGISQSKESKRKRSESIKLWWAKRKSIEDIVKS